MRERIRLYLQRHGDHGRIDPERRLKAIAADYASRRAEEARRKLGTLAIPGSTWNSIGPTNGAGRVTAIAPHPTAPGTLYVGAAGGGVWKTTDGGATWAPLTEGIGDLSVGALAIAPSSPSTIYLGTGEGGYGGDFIPGIGLLTSTDGGATWSLPSSVISPTFYRILVHPTNPQELVVGTKQGALRSTNGGATWTTVIPRPMYGDVVDLVRHPSDPQTLYAATWCEANCSSHVAKVLKSVDGGATWAEKSVGLPAFGPQWSYFYAYNERPAIAISASNPLVLYAATALTDGTGDIVAHIYKTVDGGETWNDLPALSTSVSGFASQYMGGQPWYDNTIVVSPTNPDVVIAGGVYYVLSTDGGNTFSLAPFSGGDIHVDAHDLRYQGSTLYVGNDGGVWSSPDDARTGVARNTGLVIRQYYALANDPANRNRMVAGAQDNGTNQRQDSGGTAWRDVIGADGFECGVNSMAPDFAYGTVEYGGVYRSKRAGSGGDPGFTDISPPYSGDEDEPFFSVLTVHPTRPSTIYTGTSRVWKSDNGGDSWLPLPTNTTDGSAWTNDLITAIAVAPSNPAVLMVGKGVSVFRSADGGNTWVLASTGLSGFGVNNVEIDPRNSSVAYAAIATTFGSNVYQTTNGGTTWQARATGLPLFAAQVVRVDPTDSNTLYCGVDVGIYRSTDQGATWARFGSGLPSASVQDIAILNDGSILRVATHGRGIWELAVPASGNTPPSALISSPAAPQTVTRGASVSFTGAVSDPDPGDTAAGAWTFSDTWETVAAPAGASNVSHVFYWAGVFPVSLAASDSHGAVGASSVAITVPEDADSCALPIVLPGSGPFPYTVLANSESATADPGDPTPSCMFAGFGSFASVWFEFTPAASGTYEFSTCGGGVDTVLSVYTGPACGPYTPVTGACDDDAPSEAICAGSLASYVTVAATAGQTLRILVTGFSESDIGTFPLTVASVTAPATTPRVTGLGQRSAPSSGGSQVTLYGYNFLAGSTVAFGGIQATNVNVLDTQYLTATLPARIPGPADVVVAAPDKTSGVLADSFTFTPASGVVPCVASPTALCLNANRFKVEVSWSVPAQGTSGAGQAVPLSGDTGTFWFFNSANVELVVKALDGRAINGYFWIFYGALSNVAYTISVTDTATGQVKTYTNPSGQFASAGDTSAFFGGSAAVASPFERSPLARDATEGCAPTGTSLCLNQSRFLVDVAWEDFQGNKGVGQAVPLTSDTGTFWFFNSANVELIVKVLNGTSVNGKYWVFYGALSNVAYTVTVKDTLTGAIRTYTNPSGTFASVGDTSAF